MKQKEKLYGAFADFISQQTKESTTKTTPAPRHGTNKRTHVQAEKYFSCASDEENEDYSSDIGKKKNVTSMPIKHGTTTAQFLAVLTNNFDLTYSSVKCLL